MTDKDRYLDGTDLNQFKRLQAISRYNHNYYLGFGRDLLYAETNDDSRITEWFLVKNQEFYYLGESYEGDNNLHRFTKPRT